ncbi:hypothetical protein Csa_022763 [Cucumis sativus]|nr:hypothetical protein Csa_022763 [Cucumis sativus]
MDRRMVMRVAVEYFHRPALSCKNQTTFFYIAVFLLVMVQIQHPRLHLNRFDLVITPHHDYYPLTPQAKEQVPRFIRKWITPREPPDQRVVLTVGALHQIDFAALRSAASAWHDVFAPLPKPLLVVNIGGPTSEFFQSIGLSYLRTFQRLARFEKGWERKGFIEECGSIFVNLVEEVNAYEEASMRSVFELKFLVLRNCLQSSDRCHFSSKYFVNRRSFNLLEMLLITLLLRISLALMIVMWTLLLVNSEELDFHQLNQIPDRLFSVEYIGKVFDLLFHRILEEQFVQDIRLNLSPLSLSEILSHIFFNCRSSSSSVGSLSICVDLAKQLVTGLLSVLASCGSVRISFSDRTPEKVYNVVVKELGDNPKVYIWDRQEPNPHMGHLAWADAFVVTADSVSMISEVCSTGKPVYVIGTERCKWKYSAFHKSLKERGVIRPFTGTEDISESWSYPPLNDTAEAATRVRKN